MRFCSEAWSRWGLRVAVLSVTAGFSGGWGGGVLCIALARPGEGEAGGTEWLQTSPVSLPCLFCKPTEGRRERVHQGEGKEGGECKRLRAAVAQELQERPWGWSHGAQAPTQQLPFSGGVTPGLLPLGLSCFCCAAGTTSVRTTGSAPCPAAGA